MSTPLLDPSIFAYLESRIEEETAVRDQLTQLVQRLEKAVAAAQGLLSRVHSTPRAKCASLLPFFPPISCLVSFASPQM